MNAVGEWRAKEARAADLLWVPEVIAPPSRDSEPSRNGEDSNAPTRRTCTIRTGFCEKARPDTALAVAKISEERANGLIGTCAESSSQTAEQGGIALWLARELLFIFLLQICRRTGRVY